MFTTLYAAKLLHLVAAAAWFGHKLLIPFDLRASLADGSAQDGAALIARMGRAEKLGIGAGLVTLFSGLWMVSLAGGFRAVPFRILVGLVLVILMFVVGGMVARPGWGRVRAGLEKGDLAAARAGARQLTWAFGIEQALWLAALVAMVVKV